MPSIAASPPIAEAAPVRGRHDYSFSAKVVVAGALVALGDVLFGGWEGGSSLGVYALLLLVAPAATRPALLRSRSALAAGGAAAAFAVALADDPSLLAAALFWVAATLAASLPRSRFDNGWRWAIRLLCSAVLAAAQPVRDWALLRRARRRGGSASFTTRLPILILPAVGSLVFVLLFANANPLIGNALGRIDGGEMFGGFSVSRLALWLLLGVLAWSLLRPAAALLAPAETGNGAIDLPGVTLASVTLSLVAFNLIFAVQNGLDIAFLWSGAPLPGELTLAEYAHRGAYPLIATALLAGLFVTVTLRPGSAMAASALLRRLVYLWIAQNVLLVASTMLRTLDYVEAYSLTRLRIAALGWMVLVAVGLLLICYRLWQRRGDAWLINANLAAASLLLGACTFVDLGAVAADWNVRHTREVGGPGAALDLCYLNTLGASSLPALVELESRPIGPALRDRAAWSRNLQMDRLEAQQAEWRTWTFRGARRLASAKARVAERRLPRFPAHGRGCNALAPAPALTAPRGE
ncbi:MAG TPA: DUF4173 domain-containing protein [Allosphingosinicella sp.]|jgi:hypothetical protein